MSFTRYKRSAVILVAPKETPTGMIGVQVMRHRGYGASSYPHFDVIRLDDRTDARHKLTKAFDMSEGLTDGLTEYDARAFNIEKAKALGTTPHKLDMGPLLSLSWSSEGVSVLWFDRRLGDNVERLLPADISMEAITDYVIDMWTNPPTITDTVRFK